MSETLSEPLSELGTYPELVEPSGLATAEPPAAVIVQPVYTQFSEFGDDDGDDENMGFEEYPPEFTTVEEIDPALVNPPSVMGYDQPPELGMAEDDVNIDVEIYESESGLELEAELLVNEPVSTLDHVDVDASEFEPEELESESEAEPESWGIPPSEELEDVVSEPDLADEAEPASDFLPVAATASNVLDCDPDEFNVPEDEVDEAEEPDPEFADDVPETFEVPQASASSGASEGWGAYTAPSEFLSEFAVQQTEADEAEVETEVEVESADFSDIDSFDYQAESDSANSVSELDPSEPLEAAEAEAEADVEEVGYVASEDEEEVEEFVDPRAAKSKVSLSGNPLMKAAFIGAAGLLVVIVGGGLYSALTKSTKTDPAVANLQEQAAPTPAAALPESGKLKADLAFASQQNDLEKARRLQQAQTAPSPTPTPEVEPSPSPTPVVQQPPQITVPPVRVPAPMPMPVSAPVPTPPVDPYTDLSPIEKWQQIASIGSFGRSVTANRPAPVATSPTAPAATPAAPVRPATPIASSGSTLAQLRSNTTNGMRSAPLADVLVGTSATGAMATAVVLGGDNAEAVNPTSNDAVKYLVTLTTPIQDATGATAIPAGATLVSVVSTFSTQTGMMQLQVKSVIHNNKEYAAPQGSIIIRGENGASLRASRTGGTSPVVSALLPALLEGAAGAAEELTRSRGTTTTNGNVTTTTNESGPNLGAGFIQGASSSMAQQISQATQLANSQAQSRPQSWKLSEGKEVQVFVNNTFQM